MQSLYEILEVPEDAPIDVIKKAYRSKAQEHHPDKGGDTDMFQQVGMAYVVLKDPARRKKYDETGSTDNQTTDSVAQKTLAEIFSQMIDHDSLFGDLVERAKEWISSQKGLFDSSIADNILKISNLKKKLGRLKSKGELNLFDGIIESKISQLEASIKAQQCKLEELVTMSEILSDYEDTAPEVVQPSPTVSSSFGIQLPGASATTSAWGQRR